MAIIKCKMCGADLVLTPDSTIAECEYCGTVQTVPSADNEKKLTLFARANRLRMACEFDKAAGVYEAIVADFQEEAEAYWGLVLCKYGIEYVDDPGSGKKVPTCHRSSFDSVMDDANFDLALENADAVARKVYRDEAKQIEEIRKGIIAVSSKEDPYDIFICYKETDINGDRTLDSVLAQDIYNALTEKGYRVFFSRITLEDKLGQEYEPYIFAALNSAKVMLAVGTDYEHYNAVWVKNEWSRFLHMISTGQKKTLIPCYKNIDAYDMPKEFAKLQAQDLGKIGAMQDLLRGIGKIVGNAEPPKTSVHSYEQQMFPNNNSSLLKRGYMALEDEDWSRAAEFFEKALDQDAECGEAYFGQYLAANKLRNAEAFINGRLARTQSAQQEAFDACPTYPGIDEIINKYTIPGYFEPATIRKLFDFPRTYLSFVKGRKFQLEKEIEFFKANKSLSRAAQYASGEFAVRYRQIQQEILSKIEERITGAERDAEEQKLKVQQEYESHIASAKKKADADFDKFSQWREKDYQDVLDKYNRAETSGDFRSLSMKFEAFKGYKESKKLAADCREKADKQAQKERVAAIIKKEAEEKRLAEEKAEAERLRREKLEKERAEKRAEEEKQAAQLRRKNIRNLLIIIAIIAIVVFAIYYAKVIVPRNKYEKAQAQFYAGKYESAASAFNELGDYENALNWMKESNYCLAQQLYDMGDYYEARTLFQSLEYYNEAHKQVEECNYHIAEQLLADGKKADAAILLGSMSSNKALTQSYALWDELLNKSYVDIGYYEITALTTDGKILTTSTSQQNAGPLKAWNNLLQIINTSDGLVGLHSSHAILSAFSEHSDYDVSGWSKIVDIKAAGQFILGLKADGTVLVTIDHYSDDYDWAYGVQEWRNITAISASEKAIFGVQSDGAVVAVGNSYADEQCAVGSWRNVVDVAAGYEHTVGLMKDGTVIATGKEGPVGFFTGVQHNDGRLETDGWTDIVKVAADYEHTVGLKADGTVVAIGSNDHGQCDVSTWTDIVDIILEDTYTIGIKSNGTIVSTRETECADWNNIKTTN